MTGYKEPAFPTKGLEGEDGMWLEASQGMSLRDYFAAQAFGSIMGTITGMGDVDPDEAREVFVKLGKAIYDATDAVLEARNVR